jgi:hypothetical protein
VEHSLVTKWDTTSNQRQWRLEKVASGDYASFQCSWDGTSTASAISTTTIVSGAWYFIAGKYDGATVQVAVNGVWEHSQNMTGAMYAGTAPFAISARHAAGSPGLYADGLIYGVAVFSRVLTTAEIMDIRNNGLGYVASGGGTTGKVKSQIILCQ